jgi:hypothetical protein
MHGRRHVAISSMGGDTWEEVPCMIYRSVAQKILGGGKGADMQEKKIYI